MKLNEYRKIAPAVEADLKATLAKYNLTLRPFGARIDERLGIVRMTLECVDANHKAADGTATTPEAEIYKSHCMIFDLKLEWLNQIFKMSRDEYRIVGMKKGRAEKCILIERVSDKKVYVSTPESVRAHILLTEKTLGNTLGANERVDSTSRGETVRRLADDARKAVR